MRVDHPSVIAVRNCSRCGGGITMWFTMVIGDLPAPTPEQAEEQAREFIADGMTPAEGWELRPQIMEAMEQLGFVESP